MNEEDALRELAQGFASMAIGDKFFKSLATYLAKALEVEYVFIGELTEDKKYVHSVAFYAKDGIVENIEYPLLGSLCEEVVKPKFCAYPSHVQELFPENEALKHFGVDSYVGTPLFDSYGNVLGLIYLMHSKPIVNLVKTESLLGIVAKRAELELERERHERWLRQANQELEQRVERRTLALSKSEQNLAEKIGQLQQTNQELENFIYTASHDLKAPINNIEGLMHMLKGKMKMKGWEDQSVEAIIGMMDASVIRFKRTVADLADISKVDKQINDPWESVDVNRLVSDILLDIRIPIEQSGAQIEVQLDACSRIVFSRTNLKSILYNLISNAIKYRDHVRIPAITISCQQEEGYKVLSVADNGLGLNTSDENKIFGMFKRQHSHVEGSGVGLYIVKKIIENAGGKITVESKIGEGSLFRVYIKNV